MPQYKQKLVKSGNHLELYTYQKTMYRGYFKKKKKKKTEKKQIDFFAFGNSRFSLVNELNKHERRKDNLTRTRRNIKRLINSNPDMNKFITLTFAENVQDINDANYEFKKFVQRLKFHYGSFKYLAVIEFQKRGAVHYHLVSSLPIPDFEILDSFYFVNGKKKRKKTKKQKEFEIKFSKQFWQNGFVDCTTVKNCTNLGAYLCKYLGKETNELLYKKKKFFYSKNTLDKPLEIIDKTAIDIIFKAYKIELNTPKFVKKFYSDFAGIVEYSYYKICPI